MNAANDEMAPGLSRREAFGRLVENPIIRLSRPRREHLANLIDALMTEPVAKALKQTMTERELDAARKALFGLREWCDYTLEQDNGSSH